MSVIIPSPDPAIPLPLGLRLPPLQERVIAGSRCYVRELQMPVSAELRFQGFWKAHKLDLVKLGFYVRTHNETPILGQALHWNGKAWLLTPEGENRLEILLQPADQPFLNLTVNAPVYLPLLASLEAKLLPHQIQPARQIYRALSKGRDEWGYPGAVDLSDCGVGKTYTTLAVALQSGLKPCILCPVVGREGWLAAFRHFGAEPHFIESYEAVRGGWRSHIVTVNAAGSFTWMNPREIILILDEAQACFPASTLISTEIGQIPIGKIVENRMQIRVHSFDFQSKTMCLRPIKNWFANSPKPLVRVQHEHGEFICTGDHKIWTENQGWTQAASLDTCCCLRVVSDGDHARPASARHNDLAGVEAPIRESSTSLQGGYCRPVSETGNRSGREHPQAAEVEVLGPPENRSFGISRVVGVEVLESGGGQRFAESCPDMPLYDFEVEGTHCYFAEGVLVHNCRHDDSLTAKCCAAAIQQGVPILIASATIATSPLEFKFAGRITGLHHGGDDWRRFLIQHGCSRRGPNKPWEWDKDLRHLRKIHARLFPSRGARVAKEELGDDCPETEITVLPFDVEEGHDIQRAWREAIETIERLEKQHANGAQIQAMRRSLRMRIWKRCEMALVPLIAARAREDIRCGRSVAIFMNFDDSRIQMGDLLKTRAGFYGGQNKRQRAYYAAEFQANREHALISNIRAGGASVSLHDLTGERPRTSYVFPTDNPVEFKQAFGRIDRVNGMSKSLQFIPCVKGAMSEAIVQRARMKMLRMSTINDGDRAELSF